MSINQDVYFNTNNLTENSKVEVCYSGELFKKGSSKVYMHCGYNDKWSDIKDIEMRRTSKGFVTELNLSKGNTLNLCFKNENNEWDNNSENDYIFKLRKNIQLTGFKEAKDQLENIYFGEKYSFKEANDQLKNIYFDGEHTFKEAFMKLNEVDI